MKLLKKLLCVSFLFLSIFFLTNCQDVIYDNIRKEVALTDGTVPGSIRSIVRFNCDGIEFFYLSNGAGIFRKFAQLPQTYGGWQSFSPSGIGDFILQLAADENYLYALTGTWEENSKKGQNRWSGRSIYCSKDGITWLPVTTFYTPTGNSSGDYLPVNLFCTNTIAASNRKAYYNYNGIVFELDGTTSTVNVEATAMRASSCASLGGKVYFFITYSSYYASTACTNETNFTDGTMYYYSYGSTLHWGKDGIDFGHIGVGSYIYSLAVTKDYLLVGTYSGIQHYRLIGGNVGIREDFSTNAYAIMGSSYEVNSLLVVNPELNEISTAIYSSLDFEGRSQQFDHICLWAYYPYRGNWNRD